MSNNPSVSRLGELGSGFPRNCSAERPSGSVTLGQGIGNGMNGWRESNNIWSQSFTSKTRDSSRTREVSAFLDPANDMMESGKGSGSLVASSEVDATVRNTHRWGSAEANRLYLRGTGDSPVRRSSTQFPLGQSLLDNSQAFSQFPPQSRGTISTTGIRSANGSFGAGGGLNGQRYNDSLPNGFGQFHRSSDDTGRSQEALGSWADALSVHSPTEDRRTKSASEYFSSAPSTAASRDGSLPGSTYENESAQFSNADVFAQFGQTSTVPRGHNSSFSSQSNGRVGSERHSSQGSDVAIMLQQFHLNNGSEQSVFSQKSTLFNNNNNNNLGSQQSPSDYTYPRHLRQDLSVNQDEGRMNGGSFTPDGFPNVQLNDNLNGLHGIKTNDRGMTTPNGGDYRHSPYYSTGDTPPAAFDPVYSRGDQLRPLANTALLDRKLSRLQQEQQQQRFPQSPYQPILPPQFRNQFNPYAGPYGLSNGLSVATVGPNLPLNPSIQAGFIPPAMISTVESSRGPNNDGSSIRSQKLEDFKLNSKNKTFTLRDITGHFVEFSGDQNGSRFIQQKLESANSDEKQAVFEEILPNVMQLMQDVFGNYVIQKFFEHGDQTQKKILANKMKGHVLSLSLGMYGCRVVQKALEYVLVDQQVSLIKELDNYVMKCVKDQNGNHVIQKAIECVAHEHIQFIFDAFSGQVGQLAIHSYGCRVIQRILERGSPPLKKSIIQELHQCGSTLVSDQFGNYVTQGIISLGSDKDKEAIINLVKANIMAFSRHKYASNVVEKCLTEGTDEQKNEMMLKVLERTDNRDSNLISMIKDQYANYVLQRFLDTVSPVDYRILVEALQPEMVKAKRLTTGKQITAIEKKMHRFPLNNTAVDDDQLILGSTSVGASALHTTSSAMRSPDAQGLLFFRQ